MSPRTAIKPPRVRDHRAKTERLHAVSASAAGRVAEQWERMRAEIEALKSRNADHVAAAVRATERLGQLSEENRAQADQIAHLREQLRTALARARGQTQPREETH